MAKVMAVDQNLAYLTVILYIEQSVNTTVVLEYVCNSLHSDLNTAFR